MKLYALLDIDQVSSYNKILMPLEDAIPFCKSFSEAKMVHTDYSGNVKEMEDYKDQINLKILSEDRVKELMLEGSLEFQN